MIPLADKRSMIEEPEAMNLELSAKERFGKYVVNQISKNQQCKLLSLPKSSFYFKSNGPGEHKLAAMRLIDELYLEDPTRGTRRYQYELFVKGFTIGRDAIRSMMRLMGIEAIYRKPRTTVIDPGKYKYPYLLRNLDITEQNQVWALDISYIPMKHGFMYLLAIMDVYSRCIVGWSVSNSMDAEWVVLTLQEAFNRHGKPQIINSDQGSQFTSDEYVNFIKSQQTINISMDGKGRAIDNVFIERFFRTIKYECLYLHVPENGTELFTLCRNFIHYYNEKRPHSSIGYCPPTMVYRSAA
jgi:putative transposase